MNFTIPDLTLAVIAGFISAALLSMVIGTWNLLTWRLHNRSLKAVCGFRRGGPVRIIAAMVGEHVDRMDAYALGHLVDTCRQIGLNTELRLLPDEDFVDEPYDLVIVGGPQNSQVSRRYLQGMEKFSIIALDGKHLAMSDFNDKEGRGYAFGDQEFVRSDRFEYAALIKLPHELSGGARTVHLMFGNRGSGTAGAAYYLWTHFDKIHREVGSDPYFAVIRVGHTYKDVREEPVFIERL